ncbi:hypothetical protein CVT26_002948 [Gymnopilus dilepis]|uniref:Uncharacterized protein n=1 Tax=Gymnopilus dilepis TaxID=231916 RepID=A0A409Y4R0_9AGAR|nr:hypothetical protein CVT26_002948 [Gymnopilus dilepis]
MLLISPLPPFQPNLCPPSRPFLLSFKSREFFPTATPTLVNSTYGTRSSTPTSRPTFTLQFQSVATQPSGPSAAATNLNLAVDLDLGIRTPGCQGGVLQLRCNSCSDGDDPSAFGAGAAQHVFLSLFGGTDDRLALKFVVQICVNPRMRAAVVVICLIGRALGEDEPCDKTHELTV